MNEPFTESEHHLIGGLGTRKQLDESALVHDETLRLSKIHNLDDKGGIASMVQQSSWTKLNDGLDRDVTY